MHSSGKPLLSSEEIEELLSRSEWIQSLARRLVVDANVADDIVQQTYFAALRSQPRTDRLTSWVGRVVRNFVPRNSVLLLRYSVLPDLTDE